MILLTLCLAVVSCSLSTALGAQSTREPLDQGAAAVSSLPQGSVREPVATTQRFAFFSEFETNLNDALIAAGDAREARRPELFRSGSEAGCFDTLPSATKADWDRAVVFYARRVTAGGWTGREQASLRLELAGMHTALDSASRPFRDSARVVRAGAAAAYRQCRWTTQDARNRAWVSLVMALLGSHEEVVVARLESLYERQWVALPILVDVVETVSWSGANSFILDDGGGHLLVSPSYEGPSALETVFHEASHLLMTRNAPMRQALEAAATAAKYRLPGDLWHAVLFYQTGEVVRQILAANGVPEYRPMLYGIFDRGTWTAYRPALEAQWRAYVDGTRSLSEASAGLVRELSTSRE